MQRTQGDLYPLVKDLRTKAQFTREISKRYRAYGELLDKDTIAFLLVDELGRNSFSLTAIAALKSGMDATVVATVQAVSEVKTFRKKNGTVGKVLNLDIMDDSGGCRLALWNQDIELVKSREIAVGTRIRVINGYTKDGFGGVELNLGKWGMLDVEPDAGLVSIKEGTDQVLSGVLQSRDATKAFFKDNGDFGFVTTISVKTAGGEVFPVTLWDASVKAIQGIRLGEAITLQNVSRKTVNGAVEWHLNGDGRVLHTEV